MQPSNYIKASDTIEANFWDGEVPLQPEPGLTAWKDASPAYFAHDWNNTSCPAHETFVRAVWTPDRLCLLFECHYEKLTVSPDARADIETNKLWEISDVAEAFIAPNPDDILHYKEFQVSPAGQWVDLAIDREKIVHDWTWNSGFRVAAHIDVERRVWSALMLIPLAAFGPERPTPGTRWRVNFFRMEQAAPKKLLSWQPPLVPNFHTPQAFGWLVFKK